MHYAGRRTQNAADAEDVYQDVFLRLLREPQAAVWTEEHTKAWLVRCTLNRCSDLHSSFWKKSVLPLDALPELEGEITALQSANSVIDTFDGAVLRLCITFTDGSEQTKTLQLHTGKLAVAYPGDAGGPVLTGALAEGDAPYSYGIYADIV